MPTKSLKIMHVAQAIAKSYGGVQTVLADLSKAQVAAGHRVSIVTTNVDPQQGTIDIPKDTLVEREGVRIFACSVIARSILFSPSFASVFKRELKDTDIVHIHGLYRFPPTYAAYQVRKQGIPYVICSHGSLSPYMYSKSTAGSIWLKRLYERWFDLPNLNAAGAIHYTTVDERERASFLKLRAPSFVVPNGLDWSEYAILPARGALRAWLGLSDAPVVLFLGRLHFKKGLDILIPAFDSVRRQFPDVKLLIAGPENDEYGKKVRGWVAERGLQHNVLFVGMLQGAEVLQAYVDADVFALPSYTENFGMTVVEAITCGLPVVISDQVNIHAEVAAAGAGVVTRCDSGELSAALLTLLGDANRRRTMGEAGRALVQRKWTWDQVVKDLLVEYERVIERHKSGRNWSSDIQAS